MSVKKKVYSNKFRAKVALEMVKGDQTIAEVCSQFGIASSLASKWKKQLLEGATAAFDPSNKIEKNQDAVTAPLYEQIGKLKVENDFLKKKCLL
jgi:putative transposase|tara:strand:+ start:80 stop:361 length:282 start_codon:yes stop_codon:yes gene_type:complete